MFNDLLLEKRKKSTLDLNDELDLKVFFLN